MVTLLRAFQNKVNRLALAQGKGRLHASLPVLLQWQRRCQAQAEALTLKKGALIRHLDSMRVARIVKARLTGEDEGHRTMHNCYGTNEAMLMFSSTCALNGHKVGKFTGAISAQKAREQDVGFRQV